MANVLTWLSIGSGITAAGLWLWACRVSAFPNWVQGVNSEPVDEVLKQMSINTAVQAGWNEAGKRNAWAAGATGGTVALQALAQIVQQWAG